MLRRKEKVWVTSFIRTCFPLVALIDNRPPPIRVQHCFTSSGRLSTVNTTAALSFVAWSLWGVCVRLCVCRCVGHVIWKRQKACMHVSLWVGRRWLYSASKAKRVIISAPDQNTLRSAPIVDWDWHWFARQQEINAKWIRVCCKSQSIIKSGSEVRHRAAERLQARRPSRRGRRFSCQLFFRKFIFWLTFEFLLQLMATKMLFIEPRL